MVSAGRGLPQRPPWGKGLAPNHMSRAQEPGGAQPVAIKHTCLEHTGVHTHAASVTRGPHVFTQHVVPGTSYTAVKGGRKGLP